MATNPYYPNQVPSINGVDGLPDLERFLSEELERIAVSIRTTSVMAMYGGLWLTSAPAAQQSFTTTYAVLDGFDATIPQVQNRTICEVSDNSITVLENGVIACHCALSMETTRDTFW